jgi:hypothetical protein
MLKSFYIQHDYSARNDQKILQLRFKFGWEGYGIFWAICETMAEDTTGYINREAIGGLSISYGVAIDKLQIIFDYCVEIKLFHICEHGNYYNQRILDHKKERLFYSEKGIEGNIKRWGHRPANRKDSIEENRKKKSILAFPLDFPGYRLSFRLWNKIKESGTLMKEPNLQIWAEEIRKLHDINKIPWDVIDQTMTNARKDSFWEKNIRSAKSLRKNILNGNLDKYRPLPEKCMPDEEYQKHVKEIVEKEKQNGQLQ